MTVLGDFNHCKLELLLPGFEQYVKCPTRDNRILDKCYGNVKRAYVARFWPPLVSSDHNTVHLIPTYKTVLKSSKPIVKNMQVWSENSIESLKGCILCTDWDIFNSADLDESMEVITDYSKKQVTIYPNNKVYITKEIKYCINSKKTAFRNHDRVALQSVQKELNQLLRAARKIHKNILEDNFYKFNTQKMWNSIKDITNIQLAKKMFVSNDDMQKADDLNCFFLRFDTQNYNQECMKELSSIITVLTRI